MSNDVLLAAVIFLLIFSFATGISSTIRGGKINMLCETITISGIHHPECAQRAAFRSRQNEIIAE